MLIPGDQCSVQCFDDIAVLGSRCCKDIIIVHFHIRCSNISDSDQPFQLLTSCYRQCLNILIFHSFPCVFNGHVTRYTLNMTDIHIFYLKVYIVQKRRHTYLKFIQNICCLTIYLARSFRYVLFSCDFIFQIRICNCRTDRICIRIFMSDHIYFLWFFLIHFILLHYYLLFLYFSECHFFYCSSTLVRIKDHLH